MDAITWGPSPAEIQEPYPNLSLAQSHAALAHYHDHQAEIDAQPVAWYAEYDRLRAAHPNPLTREQWEARRRAQQEDSRAS